ncbi:MerR family transcriptional regulator [Brachybacterium sp.]|uniref:MerR family transcriptional regulator n=1 Tax=Brachybacterium sp. TaxID=1891286 RepID=UPI002ED0C5FD
MRSSHLARLAGISTRTLRHYHHVGVLEEPARSSNGYRDYEPAAVVTLLRIRRLVELGFSLAQISTILHDSQPTQNELYDSLEAELSAQIDHLTRQREHLALLKRHGAPPDLPPEIAAPHSALRRSGLSEIAAAADRDHSLILAQVLGARGQAYVTAVYTLISRPEHARTTAAAMTAWATLGDAAAEREIDQLTEQFTEIFAPILRELTTEDAPGLPVLTDTELRKHGAEHLTASQLEVLERLQAALHRADDDV